MFEINEQMKFFIAKKFEEDSKWKNLEVIFSGTNTEGEGEHKIFNFIRDFV